MKNILFLLLFAIVLQNCFAEEVIQPQLKEENVEQLGKTEHHFDQDKFLKRIAKMNALMPSMSDDVGNFISTYLVLVKQILPMKRQIRKLQKFMKVGEDKLIKSSANFEKIGEKYYHIENREKLNWNDSLAKCNSMNSSLISLQNDGEWTAITKKLRPYNNYWLDINNLKSGGEYVSESTGEKAPFLKWAYTEPNKLYDERCIHMRKQFTVFDTNIHFMNDVSCSTLTYYICERTSTPNKNNK